jgi:hypothetical protein
VSRWVGANVLQSMGVCRDDRERGCVCTDEWREETLLISATAPSPKRNHASPEPRGEVRARECAAKSILMALCEIQIE